MKTLLKLVFSVLLLAVLAVVGLLSYAKLALPKIADAESIKAELTEARIERGRYLAHHVAVCIDCHSQRDWSLFSGPPIDGTWGQGGEVFDQKFGFPGKFVAKNITPHGVGDWTDGELLRAITTGVNREGEPFFPIMPYPSYGTVDKEDILSIIAYIRGLKPIETKPEASVADFPMNFIMRTIPKEAQFQKKPAKSNKVEYGKYLVTFAGCAECHTQQVKGQKVEGMEFAGGFEFKMPNGSNFSKNITPHKTSGIGNWTEEMFVGRFKAYVDSNYVPQKYTEKDIPTPMPWVMYGGMEEEDLAAIFAYLQTLAPNPYKPPEPSLN